VVAKEFKYGSRRVPLHAQSQGGHRYGALEGIGKLSDVILLETVVVVKHERSESVSDYTSKREKGEKEIRV